MQMTHWKTFAFESYIPQIHVLVFFQFFISVRHLYKKKLPISNALITKNNPAYIVSVQLILD